MTRELAECASTMLGTVVASIAATMLQDRLRRLPSVGEERALTALDGKAAPAGAGRRPGDLRLRRGRNRWLAGRERR